MEQQFMSADETDRYVDSRIERALQERRRAPRRGFMQSVGRAVNIIVSLVLFSLLGAVLYYIAAMQYHLPLPLNLTATEQTVYSTSVPAQQPLPTQRVYMSPVPPQEQAPVINVAQPTLTLPPTPTVVPSFWTAEEQTQIVATATAFIEVIPTAPPEFIKYTQEQCRDPEKVADSWMLQQMCGVSK